MMRSFARQNFHEDAQTRVMNEKKQRLITMKKYVCTVCSYVYDHEVVSPEHKIPPGTLARCL